VVPISAPLVQSVQQILLRCTWLQLYVDFSLYHKQNSVQLIAFVVNQVVLGVVVFFHQVSDVCNYLFLLLCQFLSKISNVVAVLVLFMVEKVSLVK
jgi:hypothetical protein